LGTTYAPAGDLFSRNAPGIAWKSKPSWFIVVNNDRTVHPDLALRGPAYERRHPRY
jgi:hypothetical protein